MSGWPPLISCCSHDKTKRQWHNTTCELDDHYCSVTVLHHPLFKLSSTLSEVWFHGEGTFQFSEYIRMEAQVSLVHLPQEVTFPFLHFQSSATPKSSSHKLRESAPEPCRASDELVQSSAGLGGPRSKSVGSSDKTCWIHLMGGRPGPTLLPPYQY